MDTEIDKAIMELLALKAYKYLGIDVRIRGGGRTTFSVWRDEDELPENTSDDDIARLKEKLELLKKIDAMIEKLKKYESDGPIYVPYYPPSNPWRNPWCDPWITWSDDNTVGNYLW